MLRGIVIGFCFSLLGLAAAPHADAQETCAGDCNADGNVLINELVNCVNIALGTSPLAACTACDADGSGTVAINELVAAVNAALNGCGSTIDVICGNGTEEADEECDDGNNLGGDLCAANCTNEVRRVTTLDSSRSGATVQLGSIPIPLTLSGSQALISGTPRDVETIGPNGRLFGPREFPLAVKAEDAQFNPVKIVGLACACVRGVAVPEFGPGVSGIGVVSCADEGLTDINFRVSQDHNTTPGNAGNSGSANGLPDDPECNDVFDAGDGVRSEACLEGSGADCSTPDNEHLGACISPRVYTFFGGPGGRGSVTLRNSSAIGLLQDQGTCAARTPLPNGNCPVPDYGPDCAPCTDDDVEKGEANVSPTTSGTAEVLIYDSGSVPGARLGVGEECGTMPCVGSVTGEPADCDALEADPNAPLTGALVTASPVIDAAMVGDNVVTTKLAAQVP